MCFLRSNVAARACVRASYDVLYIQLYEHVRIYNAIHNVISGFFSLSLNAYYNITNNGSSVYKPCRLVSYDGYGILLPSINFSGIYLII